MNGFKLLKNNEPANQILGLYGLIALNVSLKKIAKSWSIGIFEHISYVNSNRERVEFGEKDTYWKMYEKYNNNFQPGIHEGDLGSQIEGGWHVTVEYVLNHRTYIEEIGFFKHGFNPSLIEKHFLKYLKKWEKLPTN